MEKQIKLKKNIIIFYVLLFLIVFISIIVLFLKNILIKSNFTNKSDNSNNIVKVENNTVENIPGENVENKTPTEDDNKTLDDNKNATDNEPTVDNKTSPTENETPSVTKPNSTYVQDEFLIDDITNEDAKNIFIEKHAMVVGDSMGEGLDCYKVLNSESVVWARGRRIDTMKNDLDKVITYNPKFLFLSYGANDIKSWSYNYDGWINKYREVILMIQSALPETKIIVNSVLPVGDYALQSDPSFTYQETYNEKLKELAKELGIQFLENGVYLNDRVNSFSSDGVHPKASFFFLWGRHMASYLKSVN